MKPVYAIKGKTATLLEDYTFVICGRRITIPAGFTWDGATGPSAVLRLFVGLNRFGQHDEFTLKHDFIYGKEGDFGYFKISREACDELFFNDLQTIGWKGIRFITAKRAVRFAGFFLWPEF